MPRKLPDLDLSIDDEFSDYEEHTDLDEPNDSFQYKKHVRETRPSYKPNATVQHRRLLKKTNAQATSLCATKSSSQNTIFHSKSKTKESLSENTKINKKKELITKDENLSRQANKTDDQVPVCFVVIGDVDSGKSTLMGQLFYQAGVVLDKDLNKLKKECEDSKKRTSFYAWLFDESEEERQSGITRDITIKTLKTQKRLITVMDAPGHKDFIPRMLKGAMIADAAILVIEVKSSKAHSFSSTQTQEQLELIRCLGINSILIVINKMDRVAWNQAIYESLTKSIERDLQNLGFSFSTGHLIFTAVSALYGQNITNTFFLKEKADWNVSWLHEKQVPCLLESMNLLAISPFQSPDLETNSSLSLCILDIWGTKHGAIASGKIIEGMLSVGDIVHVCPSGVKTKILELKSHTTEFQQAVAGIYLDQIRLDIDPNSALPRSILCANPHHFVITTSLTAIIKILHTNQVILPGQSLMLHLHLYEEPAILSSLNELISRKSNSIKIKNPRYLTEQDKAIVTLCVEKPVYCRFLAPDKEESGIPLYSKIILRHQRLTLAYGFITFPA